MQYPSHDGGMYEGDAALSHQFTHIAVAELVGDVPADGLDDEQTVEVAAFEERRFDSFRAYYEFVPKGRWTVEYTVRFNNAGTFELPATRVEALYAPEMFGERPNERIAIRAVP